MISNVSNDNHILQTMDALNIQQIILQGPPGTSKTYGAKQIVLAAIPENLRGNSTDADLLKRTALGYTGTDPILEVQWDIVQFHPSYSYEDFVRGITVETKKKDDSNEKYLSYDTVNKIFGEICKKAQEAKNAAADDNKGCRYFLIIDEINRADVATVFGELIYALEYRNEAVSTPYKVDGKQTLLVPDNLYVIGTMNTADKSIGSIDMAIRRRFLFFDRLPDRNVIIQHFESSPKEEIKEMKVEVVSIFDYLKCFVDDTINSNNYKAKHFEIGHTFFLPKLTDNSTVESVQEELKKRLQYQVIPMLREYVDMRIINLPAKDTQKELYNPYEDLILTINGSNVDYTTLYKALQSKPKPQNAQAPNP